MPTPPESPLQTVYLHIAVAASEPNQHPSQDWPSCDLSTPAGDGDGTAVPLSEMTNHFEGFLSS